MRVKVFFITKNTNYCIGDNGPISCLTISIQENTFLILILQQTRSPDDTRVVT